MCWYSLKQWITIARHFMKSHQCTCQNFKCKNLPINMARPSTAHFCGSILTEKLKLVHMTIAACTQKRILFLRSWESALQKHMFMRFYVSKMIWKCSSRTEAFMLSNKFIIWSNNVDLRYFLVSKFQPFCSIEKLINFRNETSTRKGVFPGRSPSKILTFRCFTANIKLSTHFCF